MLGTASRLQTGFRLSLDSLNEFSWLLGGNDIDGNALNNQLGTKNFYDLKFITYNRLRGGYRDTGERFLTNPNTPEKNQFLEKYLELTTTTDNPYHIFEYTPFDDTMTKFTIDVSGLSADKNEYANFEKKIILLKLNGTLTISRETTEFTHRNNRSITSYFQIVGDKLRFYVKPTAKTFNWTGTVNFFTTSV